MNKRIAIRMLGRIIFITGALVIIFSGEDIKGILIEILGVILVLESLINYE